MQACIPSHVCGTCVPTFLPLNSLCLTGYSNACRALAGKSRVVEDLEAVAVAVVEAMAVAVVAVVEAMAAREATVVVEDTSRVVEEDTMDRVAMVVVVDTSRVVEEDTVVADTEHCSAAALASSACWV